MLDFIMKIVASEKFYLPVIYIAIGVIVYYIISYFIRKINRINDKVGNKIISDGHAKRKNTVIGLINNIIKYIIAIIIIINILNVYKVNTSSILASLGIASVVIGLAFQDIIKDFLAGIFIVFDNAYAVGDWVTIDNFKGEVISMGLKTTKLRSYTGEVLIISNSSLNKVINYNLSNPRIYLEIPFSYDEKIEKIEKNLQSILDDINKDKGVIHSELLGVEKFDSSDIKYSLFVDCKVGEQYRIKRMLLRNIKVTFDSNHIVIPYNQIDVHIDK